MPSVCEKTDFYIQTSPQKTATGYRSSVQARGRPIDLILYRQFVAGKKTFDNVGNEHSSTLLEIKLINK